MEGDILAQQAIVGAQAFREARRPGVQQDQVRVHRAGIYKDDLGVVFPAFPGVRVNDSHPRSRFLLLVVDHGIDHGVVHHGQVTRPGRPGDGARVAAEVPPERASPLAEVPVLALGPSLLREDLPALGYVGSSSADDIPAGEVLFHGILEMSLQAIQFHRREKVPIRKIGQPVAISRDAHEALHMAVPFVQVAVAYGPVDGKAVPGRALEVKIAPSLGAPCPDQGFASGLISPDPVEGLLLDIGMLLVLDHEVDRVFLEHIAAAGYRVLLPHFFGETTPVLELPGIHVGRRVVYVVPDLASSLKDQGFQPFLTEFLGGPASAHSRADHNRVKALLFLAVYVEIRH